MGLTCITKLTNWLKPVDRNGHLYSLVVIDVMSIIYKAVCTGDQRAVKPMYVYHLVIGRMIRDVLSLVRTTAGATVLVLQDGKRPPGKLRRGKTTGWKDVITHVFQELDELAVLNQLHSRLDVGHGLELVYGRCDGEAEEHAFTIADVWDPMTLSGRQHHMVLPAEPRVVLSFDSDVMTYAEMFQSRGIYIRKPDTHFTGHIGNWTLHGILAINILFGNDYIPAINTGEPDFGYLAQLTTAVPRPLTLDWALNLIRHYNSSKLKPRPSRCKCHTLDESNVHYTTYIIRVEQVLAWYNRSQTVYGITHIHGDLCLKCVRTRVYK